MNWWNLKRGREAVNISRCREPERRKVDKKDGAVDHCRTANQRWTLIGGEEEQAGAKAQQKNRTWAFLGTLDSPSSPRHLRLSILSSFLPQLCLYLPSFDSSGPGDFIYNLLVSTFSNLSIL